MGGHGSGERWRKKRTAKSCRSVDTADLRRWGWLVAGERAGVLTWQSGFGGLTRITATCDLAVTADGGHLRLRYTLDRHPGEAFDYRVRLVTTPCRLGGRRWWFVCPLARERRGVRPAGPEGVPGGPVLRVPAVLRPEVPGPAGE